MTQKRKIYRQKTHKTNGLREVTVIHGNFVGEGFGWIERYEFYNDGQLVNSIPLSGVSEDIINNFLGDD